MNQMRIGIDVQPLQTGTRYAGIGCFLRNLLQRLSRLDTANDYVLFLNHSDYLATVTPPAPAWQTCHVARKHRLGRLKWLWDTIYLPRLLLKNKIDLYHYNSLSEFELMTPPYPLGTSKVIATIYDLIPLKFPELSAEYFSSSWGNFDYTAKLNRLHYANAIITISECSKQDLMSLLHYPEDRIFVAYCGIADIFRQPRSKAELTRFRAKYGLPEEFLLYLGGYYSPRKNLDRLFEAYKRLLQERITPKPPLVLAGLFTPEHQTWVKQQLAEKRMTDHILTLPYIPDEELPLLYRSAALFVYPSLYEGFGLPVAEAMACGTVVATSQTSSLPEIVGDAGLYFDPYNVNSMAEMLHKGLTDTTFRARVAQTGPQRAKRFTWDQTAQTILSVYEQVYQG
jgi:glycosyltransferase involved in cell wall biosynthesis